MKRASLPIALIFASLAPAAMARGVTVTSTAQCSATAGLVQCNRHSLWSGAAGRSAVLDRATTLQRGQVTSTLTGTTSGGRSLLRQTQISRSGQH